MIMQKESVAPPNQRESIALLEETARAVKIMKASWLRVAMNLQTIRRHALWKLCPKTCETFEEYVYGVLDINRGVARRMLDAMDYAGNRRPQLLEAVAGGDEDVHVPSYDTLNRLRRAQSNFAGREAEFEELEARVFDEGIGRTNLKKEIDSRFPPAEDSEAPAGQRAEQVPVGNAPTLESILAELKSMQATFRGIGVAQATHKALFSLMDAVQREIAGRPSADEKGDASAEGRSPEE